MSKSFFLFPFLLVSVLLSQAQIMVQPLGSKAEWKVSDKARVSADTPLTLPFWDDFSLSSGQPDTALWESGIDVFISGTLAKNPPSINVATFDGAAVNGRPHNAGSELGGPADSLVSQPIDLSLVPFDNRSTVFLSFFWQLLGNGEIPESNDSIRLQILDADTVWHTVWSETGGQTTITEEFQTTLVQIRESQFFHRNFQFKFQSFNSLGGVFDTWHLDYIYLNQDRTSLRILDRTISRGPGPLLGDFYRVPLHQYLLAPTFSQQNIQVTNLDNTIHPLDYTQTLTNTVTGEVITQKQIIGRILTPLESRIVEGVDSLSLGNLTGDSIVIESEFFYKTGDRNLFEMVEENGDTVFLDIDLTRNDTVRQFFTLHEDYAYDDGTAEFAAGINLDRGQLAVMFTVPEADTLTEISIFFPTFSRSTGQAIDVIVWDNLSETGEATRQAHIIEESTDRDVFTSIQISPTVVSDTFFIGFQQFTDDYIGIGLDRSNDAGSNKMFFNTDRTWQQNTGISGALMMRPVFGNTSEIILSTSDHLEEERTILYPNPTKGILSVKGNYDLIEIFNLGGSKKLEITNSPNIDVSSLSPGLYLVRIIRNDIITTTKLIIE